VTGLSNQMITRVAWYPIDLDGFQDHVLAYVVPGQIELLILSVTWLKRNGGSVDLEKRIIFLWKYSVVIAEQKAEADTKIREISGLAYILVLTRT